MMVPLAMGMGLPWGIYLPPMLAGMAMSFSSVSVVISSLLLRTYRAPNSPSMLDQSSKRMVSAASDMIPLTSFPQSHSIDEESLLHSSPTSGTASFFWSRPTPLEYQSIKE